MKSHDRYSGSNYQQLNCLLNNLFRAEHSPHKRALMEMLFSAMASSYFLNTAELIAVRPVDMSLSTGHSILSIVIRAVTSKFLFYSHPCPHRSQNTSIQCHVKRLFTDTFLKLKGVGQRSTPTHWRLVPFILFGIRHNDMNIIDMPSNYRKLATKFKRLARKALDQDPNTKKEMLSDITCKGLVAEKYSDL